MFAVFIVLFCYLIELFYYFYLFSFYFIIMLLLCFLFTFNLNVFGMSEMHLVSNRK